MSRLAAVVAGVLLVVGVLPVTGPDLLVVALAVLAVAASGLRSRSFALTPRPLRLGPIRERSTAPRPRRLATDPTHHPLAPRAPGLA